MGQYSKNLELRVLNKGPNVGFCVICGDYGKLSKDHVPPKGCNNVKDHILTAFHKNISKGGVTSQGGTHFKTLCETCNSERLGLEYDTELVKLSNEVTSLAISKIEGRLALPSEVYSFVKPQRIARAVVGHALAGVSVNEAKSGLISAPFQDALRSYFLNKDAAMPDELNIYYWLYPSKMQVIIKGAYKANFGTRNGILGHIFKFLPLGFWLVWEKPVEININLNNLVTNKSCGVNDVYQLPINLKHVQSVNFPEAPEGNEGVLLSDELTSIAHPKI